MDTDSGLTLGSVCANHTHRHWQKFTISALFIAPYIYMVDGKAISAAWH